MILQNFSLLLVKLFSSQSVCVVKFIEKFLVTIRNCYFFSFYVHVAILAIINCYGMDRESFVMSFILS